MDKLEELRNMVDLLEVDLKKFYTKNNNAASIRARKMLQEIKHISQDIRMEISKVRKER